MIIEGEEHNTFKSHIAQVFQLFGVRLSSGAPFAVPGRDYCKVTCHLRFSQGRIAAPAGSSHCS
jgi:hypothetical protein